MQIGAQEQAVGDLVGAAVGVGLDVGGVEDGQAVLAGGGAGAGVGLGDGEAEGALAEAGADELLGAVAVVGGGRVGDNRVGGRKNFDGWLRSVDGTKFSSCGPCGR